MKIGIDLDDVLADFVPSFLNFYNAKYGKKIRIEEIHSFDLWKCGIGKTREEASFFIKQFYESADFDSISLIKGAGEAVDYLSENNDLSIITSRNPEAREKTEKFLQRYFPKIPVFYSGGNYSSGKTKAEICSETGREIFIEDCLNYAVECSKLVGRVLLFDRPWNQENVDVNILRVKNWGEILEKLNSIGDN